MGLRIKRYGPLSTMVVVGRLVGTCEPARLMVAIAQANSASARANIIAPSQPAGTAAGTNGKGMSQLSASPANTATAHAIGGRKITFAVSVVSAMAGLLNLAPLSMWGISRPSNNQILQPALTAPRVVSAPTVLMYRSDQL